MSLHDEACSFCRSAVNKFNKHADSVCKRCIEQANGRKRKHPITAKGSYVYVAYENEIVLYVGETRTTIKNRFITDGSGSHCQKNSDWYLRMTHVRFLELDSDEECYRKLIEKALIMDLCPEFQGP